MATQHDIQTWTASAFWAAGVVAGLWVLNWLFVTFRMPRVNYRRLLIAAAVLFGLLTIIAEFHLWPAVAWTIVGAFGIAVAIWLIKNAKPIFERIMHLVQWALKVAFWVSAASVALFCLVWIVKRMWMVA